MKDLQSAIGGTPLIRLSRSLPDDVEAEIWVKLEFMNPTGSVKDRVAYYMIKEAERQGRLRKGMKIVVATTGNTGISFAAIGAAMGYKVTVVIPESMSKERHLLLQLLGAEVVRTPGGESDASKAIEVGRQLEKECPGQCVFLDQWVEEANVRAHYETTGEEILKQLGRMDAFVANIGTGGTLVGVGLRLKEVFPDVRIVGAEPEECAVTFHWIRTGVEGPCRPHIVEGVGDGLVPPLIKKYRDVVDDFVTVPSAEALETAKRLARLEGLAVGISSGANVAAAVKVARKYGMRKGVKVVTVLPDYAARYFSTQLFGSSML
ncbi:MAG: PLP-dependent cysteine synthase family protein [Desulfurococcales archaeon]|nr:PLP-dependent cysteine synthase family protein [Desulfurococcales archaeon]